MPVDERRAQLGREMGAIVRSWRERKGLSRRELAARTGVSLGSLHHIEAGHRVLGMETMILLSRAFGARFVDEVVDCVLHHFDDRTGSGEPGN